MTHPLKKYRNRGDENRRLPSAYRPQLPRSVGSFAVIAIATVGALFLALPLAALLLRAIENNAWSLAPGSLIPGALYLSIVTTIMTSLVTIVFGTPLAWVLARRQFPLKRWLNVLIELPIVLPPAVAGLALLLTFGRRGLLGGTLEAAGIMLPFTTAAVIVAQVFVSAPFYVRAAQIGFRGVDRELEDAARVDGANGSALFWYITLPLAARALAAGLVLSWARALGEFGATILFAGSLQGRTQTMPLLIYNIIERDLDAAVWTGVILIALAVVALVLSQVLTQRVADGS
ncbi:MAG: ABC transporter permease [Chloroflexota bacterium]|nr:ABC transporter permease [Chloroflexota bacterium]